MGGTFLSSFSSTSVLSCDNRWMKTISLLSSPSYSSQRSRSLETPPQPFFLLLLFWSIQEIQTSLFFGSGGIGFTPPPPPFLFAQHALITKCDENFGTPMKMKPSNIGIGKTLRPECCFQIMPTLGASLSPALKKSWEKVLHFLQGTKSVFRYVWTPPFWKLSVWLQIKEGAILPVKRERGGCTVVATNQEGKKQAPHAWSKCLKSLPPFTLSKLFNLAEHNTI